MNNIFDEFRAALFTVWHRKWLALAVAWGVCLAGWLVVGMPDEVGERAMS